VKFESTVTSVFSIEAADLAEARITLPREIANVMANHSDRWTATPIAAASTDLAIRKMWRDNVRTWLEAMAIDTGTPEQKALWLEARLPRAELDNLARAELFGAFEKIPRWERIRATHLSHDPECAARPLDAKVEYGDGDGGVLLKLTEVETINQVNRGLQSLKNHPWLLGCDEIMGGLRFHRVICTRCKAQRFAHSYTVTIPWLDRVLSREYAL